MSTEDYVIRCPHCGTEANAWALRDVPFPNCPNCSGSLARAVTEKIKLQTPEKPEPEVIVVEKEVVVEKPKPQRPKHRKDYTSTPRRRRPKTNETLAQRIYYFMTNLHLVVRVLLVIGTAVVAVFTVLLVINFIDAATPGSLGDLTNPERQHVAPTAQVLNPNPQITKLWWEKDITAWLSSVESAKLREQENAVNFVLLYSDQIRYAKDQTFALDPTWEQKRPYFIEGTQAWEKNPTAVVVQIDGTLYNLNAYQPFTWRAAPETIVVVNEKGLIWTIEANQIKPVTLDEVILPIPIAPNPDLEIGFTK